MNLLSLISLIVAIPCLILAIYVFFKRKSDVHRVWALLNLVLASWGTGLFFVWQAVNGEQALIAWRLAHASIMFISPTFHHLVLVLCKNPKRVLLRLSYTVAGIFSLVFLFSNIFINQVTPVFGNIFYYKVNLGYIFCFTVWAILASFGFIELWKFIKSSSGIEKIQAGYLLLGASLGYLGGFSTVLPSFGVLIYPAGYAMVGLYLLVTGYAILRYQFLDVRIVMSNTAIFVAVYALVLGIPFIFGYKYHRWQISTWAMLGLATAGPFILFYLQRRAEANLLAEQKMAQATLRIFAAGMLKIKELGKLLELIIDVLKQTLRLEHVVIYLRNNENEYVVKTKFNYIHDIVLLQRNPLIQLLIERKYPIIYEEEKHISDNSKNLNNKASETISEMERLSASVIVPVLSGEVLLGFILLGKRDSKDLYSREMTEILYSFSVQFALALENFKSIEERERLLNENFEIRRFESIGLFYNSLSHQINNRFHSQKALMFNPLDIYSEGKFKELKGEERDKELTALVEDFADACKKVNGIATEGGELTRVVLDFSKGKTEFDDVKFDEVTNQGLNFVKLKYPQFEYEVKKEYPKDLLVWGSSLGIKDLIHNGVDNACHAMQKKQERGGEYTPVVTIRGRLNGAVFYLEIEDNGTGIPKDNVKKVMDPMYSTKGAGEGTGMGTTFMRQVVMKHKGSIVYESEFDKWTRVKIVLPLGIIVKSKFLELGTNGAAILSALIKNGVVADHPPAQVRLKSNLEGKEEFVRKIVKDAGGDIADADKTWAILNLSPLAEQKGV